MNQIELETALIQKTKQRFAEFSWAVLGWRVYLAVIRLLGLTTIDCLGGNKACKGWQLLSLILCTNFRHRLSMALFSRWIDDSWRRVVQDLGKSELMQSQCKSHIMMYVHNFALFFHAYCIAHFPIFYRTFPQALVVYDSTFRIWYVGTCYGGVLPSTVSAHLLFQ